MVPNLAALDACGAPLKTSPRPVISNPTKPAATTVAWSSASSRAPAIHPFQRSMSRIASSGTGFATRMSPIWRRLPGLSTRAISCSAATSCALLSRLRMAAASQVCSRISCRIRSDRA